ncbi:MAG: carbamoyl phosphate synthase small subunit, partial [Alphaproteobacteria bacterium]|nr:carbamoyl phosphate synthase small subunit [Alphaproteobacteria bacterium]
MPDQNSNLTAAPKGKTAVLVLADGTLLWGAGVGAVGHSRGEVCFNTSITGYQEILTDPSYAGQIISFTFPHIGNVGANDDDMETTTPAARGLVLRADITEPSNFRAAQHLDPWLKARGLIGVSGIDTRRLTRRIRDLGAPHGIVAHAPDGMFDIPALIAEAAEWPGLTGLDLAKTVSCTQSYTWNETTWALGEGYGALKADDARFH